MPKLNDDDVLIFDGRDASIKYMSPDKLAYMAPELYKVIEISETRDHIRTTLTDEGGKEFVIIIMQEELDHYYEKLIEFTKENNLSLDHCQRKSVMVLTRKTLANYSGGDKV